MQATARADQGIAVRWTMETSDILGGAKLSRRGTWLFLRLAPAALVVIGVVLLAMGVDLSIWLPLLAAGALLGLNILIAPRRTVNRRGRSLLGEDVAFRVDDQGAHQDLAGGHVWVEWWALTEVLDDATTIVIKRDRLPSFYIPKRAFATGADAEAFLAYVRSHLGPKWPAGELSRRSVPPSSP